MPRKNIPNSYVFVKVSLPIFLVMGLPRDSTFLFAFMLYVNSDGKYVLKFGTMIMYVGTYGYIISLMNLPSFLKIRTFVFTPNLVYVHSVEKLE